MCSRSLPLLLISRIHNTNFRSSKSAMVLSFWTCSLETRSHSITIANIFLTQYCWNNSCIITNELLSPPECGPAFQKLQHKSNIPLTILAGIFNELKPDPSNETREIAYE